MSSPRTSDQQPIFVVGPSRSGTTLMGGCLNANPDTFIAPETHFFDDLAPKLGSRGRSQLDANDQIRCEDYFLALTHRRYGESGDPEKGTMRREDLRTRAAELDSGAMGYFEAFCRLQAEAKGSSRWGEKTPRHVFRIADIVSVYPRARFVCMIRDPRAVVVSYRDFKQGPAIGIEGDPGSKEAIEHEQRRVRQSYHIVVASLIWRAVARATLRARESLGDSQIWIQRYEDLVEQPEDSLKALCNWLAIDYSPAMINSVPIGTSSYQGFRSDAGVSTAAVGRWRERISSQEVQVVQSCCGSTLTELGYEPAETRASSMAVAGVWLSLPLAVASAVYANRGRFGGVVDYVWRRARALLP